MNAHRTAAVAGTTPSPWKPARWGVALMFFTNGAVMSAMMPRYPELKAALGLSNTGFGVLVACIALGSILASALPALVIRRVGARAAATGGALIMAAAMMLVGFSPSVGAVAVLFLALGVMDAVVDAAQNVHGLRVERGLGRTVINSLHASWSVGAALAGFAAALAAGARVPLSVHLVISGIVVAGIALFASRLAAPPAVAPEPDGAPGDTAQPPAAAQPQIAEQRSEPAQPQAAADTARPLDSAGPTPLASPHTPTAPETGRRARRRGWLMLGVLGLLALIGAMIEDVGNNWSANFLHDSVGLGVAAAGYGYVTLLGCQFIGRLLGDRMTDRLGRDVVAALGGACIAAGFGVLVLIPAAWSGFLAFGLAGFGCATLIPAAYAAADSVPGLRPGSGVTAVGWLMRVGFIATSPLIGLIADAAGLRLAFLLPMTAGLGVVVIAGLLRRRARSGTAPAA